MKAVNAGWLWKQKHFSIKVWISFSGFFPFVSALFNAYFSFQAHAGQMF